MKPSFPVVLTILVVVLAGAAVSQAAVIPVSSVTGSHGGNYAGVLGKMIDGSGMNLSDPSDPATWTAISNSYPNEWQTTAFLTGATNSKIAWTVFDLGVSTAGLDDLYLWNVRESADRGTNEYNIYYSDSPTVSLPPAPSTNTLGSDYDFASGGWTLLNTPGVLNLPQRGSTPDPANAIVDLGGISARYIGIEILSNHGSTFGSGRVGLAEVAFTQDLSAIVPEPGSFVLIASGLVALAYFGRRRRRRP